MKFLRTITLKELANLVNCKHIGADQLKILGINEIHRVEEGDITFVDHSKYYERALTSAARAIIIDQKITPPDGKGLIIAEHPFQVYNKIVQHFAPFQPSESSISDSATIGQNTIIQPDVFIGHDVTIGENCIIHPNVTIYNSCHIGDDVIVHANTVIGSDAYYYKRTENGQYQKWHCCGDVIIKDKVEIGSGCMIDRGVSASTVIGSGTKIDNLVHIGHDTIIGKDCLLAAQVGVAGVVELGDQVILWGQVGVSKDVHIGDEAVVLSGSGVSKSLDGGQTYFGSPAKKARERWKELALVRRLPELWQKIKGQ